MHSKRQRSTLVILLGTILLLILIFFQSPADTQTMQETPLNEKGLVHELFRAANGELWISDFLADEIWQVDPKSGSYTVYENMVGASDGRLDSKGQLWWSDFDGSAVGRLVPGASQATLWPLPAGGNPLGLAFGASGQVWITDVTEPALYRFAPASSQLCTYSLPDNGSADYILYHADRVWLGDTKLGRILRLNPNNGAVAMWELPPGAYPQGMVFDGSGNLWWADPGLGALAKLEPGSGRLTTFAIPLTGGSAAKPEAAAVSDGAIWYSDQNGRIGLLDPSLASGEFVLVSPTTRTLAADCSAAGSGTAINVSERSGTLNWNSCRL